MEIKEMPYSFEFEGSYGLKDKAGNVILQPTYDSYFLFQEGLACVEKKKKYGWIDSAGNVVIKLEWDEVRGNRFWDEGLAYVKKKGKWGAIDRNGNIVIPVEYKSIVNAQTNPVLIEVDNDTKNYDSTEKILYNAHGQVIVPKGYSFHKVVGGCVVVKQDGKFGVVNLGGEFVIPLEYEFVWDYDEGLFKVKKDGLFGFLDAEGKTVVPIEWDELGYFSDGKADAEKDGKKVFINKKGEVVVSGDWDDVYHYDKDTHLAKVEKDGQWGVIDADGNVVIPAVWDYMDRFRNGMVQVGLDGKYGYLDTKGAVVIPVEWDDAFFVLDAEYISVCKENKWGLFDVNGTQLTPVEYSEIRLLSFSRKDLFDVVSKRKHGVVGSKGELIVPCQWKSLELIYDKDMIKAESKDETAFFDLRGNRVTIN